MNTTPRKIERDFTDPPSVCGWLHEPANPSGDALVLTHGAGGDSRSPLLAAIAESFAEQGTAVLRCDLPYRQRSPRGAPSPARAAEDREGLRRAVGFMREQFQGKIYLGGQSYGGRQASMLAAEDPQLVDGLLLISYPLHPPGRSDKLRTEHLPQLRTPVLFLHGSNDGFGSPEEMEDAWKLIPARKKLVIIDDARHGLVQRRDGPKAVAEMGARVCQAFRVFIE